MFKISKNLIGRKNRLDVFYGIY